MFENKCTKCGRIAWHPPYFEYTPIKSVPPARIELGWCNNCDRIAYIFTGEASENEEELSGAKSPIAIQKEINEIQSRIDKYEQIINKPRSIFYRLYYRLHDKSHHTKVYEILLRELRFLQIRLSHSQVLYSKMQDLRRQAKEFYKKHCSSARCLTCESEIDFSTSEGLWIRHSCGGELKLTFSGSRIHYSFEGDTVYYNSKGIVVPDFDEDGLTNRIHFDL